jgi:hypothetical protein
VRVTGLPQSCSPPPPSRVTTGTTYFSICDIADCAHPVLINILGSPRTALRAQPLPFP